MKELFFDTRHHAKVNRLDKHVNVRLIPSYERLEQEEATKSSENHRVFSIAYYCHTSGTSSGLPKPIAQTNFGLVGALPRFPGGDKSATFSSTPLYHGGFVDCFRAWTSGAMIWFFPEGLAPVTGDNLLSAISFAQKSSTVLIKYFSSVPYILQMLAEEEEGLETLRTMELVGVGGAALPESTGDKLVKAGVNLLSRLGSAECGFLMSSHRNYAQDQDWQYLRPVVDSSLLSFEPREDDLSELVVKSGWPFLVKTNRDDGSYATSDLFQAHPSKANAWRYHSRADAQITLANGKKFDPSPMEESLRASTKLLQDVLIFGSGKDYPGALLFPTSSNLSQRDLVQSIWPHMEKLNTDTQKHARITRQMLILVPIEGGKHPLEKSSKGTVMHRQAEERYGQIIQTAYNGSSSTKSANITDEELLPTVLGCFFQILGRKIDPNVDLYQQGVDSLSCIQIRKLIESSCLSQCGHRLPMNIIYDQGTVVELAKYLQCVRQGKTTKSMDEDTQLQLMRQLVEKYSDFRNSKTPPRAKNGKTVLLTGATGFLGAHILHLLRQDSSVQRICCLLRAQSPAAAHERVSEGLKKRAMPGLDPYKQSSTAKNKVICIPCELQSESIGLSEEDRQELINDTTIFIHSAWTVNFTLRLSSFEDQIFGTRNLLDLAEQASAKFVFISSTAAVISSTGETIPETLSDAASDASPLGYSRSKWVAEHVCAASYEHQMEKHAASVSVVNPVSIIRIGQLCGNDAGFWNTTEAYPLMLSTANLTGSLPDLANEVLNWMPGELAAQAVLDIAFSDNSVWENKADHNEPAISKEMTPVFHVLNYHSSPIWRQMLDWIACENEGRSFEIVQPSVWVKRLEAAIKVKHDNHPSQALLGLWKDTYSREDTDKGTEEGELTPPQFEVATSYMVSKTMREMQPLSRGRVLRMWRWIQEHVGGA